MLYFDTTFEGIAEIDAESLSRINLQLLSCANMKTIKYNIDAKVFLPLPPLPDAN